MTYVGYKIPRYSPGSTPWGTLVARNGSQPALWVSGDPAAKCHPQDTSRQSIWVPQLCWQTPALLGIKVGGFASYFRSLTTSQDLAPGRSPRSMHRASTLSPLTGCRPLRPCLLQEPVPGSSPHSSLQCPSAPIRLRKRKKS